MGASYKLRWTRAPKNVRPLWGGTFFGRGPTITGVETPQDFSTNHPGARKTTAQVEFGAKRTPQKHAKPVQRKSTDVDRQYVTRIHNKWYDLREFKHPGGPVARSLADGRDGTALFVAHHPFSSPAKLDAVLAKYEVPEEDVNKRRLEETILKENDLGDDYQWSWSDPFELELKKEVKQYFEGEAKRRGVSFFTATKATPRRWLEILVLTCIFVATVPAFVRGENWTLLATPLSCWVWMVNYWHDACHFALCRTWWINASLPYLGIWFSSPTTWYHQHVIGHHAYPNIEHKDPDLAHAPQLLREHRSVRWRPSHVTQHRWYRFTAVWAIAVGIVSCAFHFLLLWFGCKLVPWRVHSPSDGVVGAQGLHLAADFKLLCQQEYNRAVTANPRLYLTSNIAAHLFGRAIYLLTTVVWPWFVFETWQKSLVFSLVPMIVFSLTFMINSQINHLTPDTAHAHESNYYRHQIVTAQDFGEGSAFWKGSASSCPAA